MSSADHEVVTVSRSIVAAYYHCFSFILIRMTCHSWEEHLRSNCCKLFCDGFYTRQAISTICSWKYTWNRPKQFPVFRIMYYAVKDSLSSQKYKKILNTIFHLFIPKIWKLILRANSIHFLCWLVLRSLELYQAHLVDNFLHSCYLSAFEIVRIIYIPITPGGQKSKDLPPALLRWRTSYTRAWQRNGTNCSQGLAQVGKGFLKLKNNKNRLRYLTSFEQMSIPGVSSVQ